MIRFFSFLVYLPHLSKQDVSDALQEQVALTTIVAMERTIATKKMIMDFMLLLLLMKCVDKSNNKVGRYFSIIKRIEKERENEK